MSMMRNSGLASGVRAGFKHPMSNAARWGSESSHGLTRVPLQAAEIGRIARPLRTRSQALARGAESTASTAPSNCLARSSLLCSASTRACALRPIRQVSSAGSSVK